jgi:hypothetical protein
MLGPLSYTKELVFRVSQNQFLELARKIASSHESPKKHRFPETAIETPTTSNKHFPENINQTQNIAKKNNTRRCPLQILQVRSHWLSTQNKCMYVYLKSHEPHNTPYHCNTLSLKIKCRVLFFSINFYNFVLSILAPKLF